MRAMQRGLAMRQTRRMYDSTFRIVTGLFIAGIGVALLYVSVIAGGVVLAIGALSVLVGCVARGVVEGTFELEARRRNGDVPS